MSCNTELRRRASVGTEGNESRRRERERAREEREREREKKKKGNSCLRSNVALRLPGSVLQLCQSVPFTKRKKEGCYKIRVALFYPTHKGSSLPSSSSSEEEGRKLVFLQCPFFLHQLCSALAPRLPSSFSVFDRRRQTAIGIQMMKVSLSLSISLSLSLPLSLSPVQQLICGGTNSKAAAAALKAQCFRRSSGEREREREKQREREREREREKQRERERERE
jgi:hypothetical protein